jgi:hypothetical protein
MSVKPAIILAAVAAVGLAGCQHAKNALGMTKVVPDEFRVVTKAPLVVPPDYALRPPAPGEPRPQELQPESAARAVLVGQVQAADRSRGENLLVASAAGGGTVDPLIRYVVDDENGDIAHKDESFANRVMFWRKGQAATVATAANTGADTPAPIDPAAEAASVKALTGDQSVVISRAPPSRKLKLPGL